MKQIQGYNRIDTLDYLRGFALLGIVLMNIIPLLSVKVPITNTLDFSYQKFLFLFIEGKFYTIFSFLFGVGFYLFMTRATNKGMNGYLLWSRRMLVLFCMGYIHGYFQGGEVLREYAILGMFLMLFYKMKKNIVLIIGIGTLASFSVLGAKPVLTLPLMLTGFAAGQYHIFEKISRYRKNIIIFTCIMFVISLIGMMYQYTKIPSSPFPPIVIGGTGDPNIEQANQFISIGIMLGPIISGFYIGGIILLLQFKCMQTLLLPLKLYGRMALTNYLGQTFLILISGYTFHLFKNITYIQSFCLCIFIYIVQIIFSVIWLRFFVMGPLEWLWRLLTYWTVPQIRKT
ncbi:DUF418 domain-containing protein [Bacillus sp. FDAARGOS_1420]|uniref:DUF418 domain-containing protein n=1 Tax=unclassified Bacillus (in: firmicutes) TaxID=185979 RepID=UPI001C5AA92D|nr:DUF418 domain-containing protein [Bacillus sp. FDAARGOS_1420]MBW3496593.1 DUF418 domain-containing protein [Bacillus sp. FDAARGOS_1420]